MIKRQSSSKLQRFTSIFRTDTYIINNFLYRDEVSRPSPETMRFLQVSLQDRKLILLALVPQVKAVYLEGKSPPFPLVLVLLRPGKII